MNKQQAIIEAFNNSRNVNIVVMLECAAENAGKALCERHLWTVEEVKEVMENIAFIIDGRQLEGTEEDYKEASSMLGL